MKEGRVKKKNKPNKILTKNVFRYIEVFTLTMIRSPIKVITSLPRAKKKIFFLFPYRPEGEEGGGTPP